MKHLFIFAIVALLFCSCGEDEIVTEPYNPYLDLPSTPYDYASLPLNAPHPSNDNSPLNNRVTNDGATLGRVLFYETALSENDAISCASCHKQEFAFADNVAKSQGVNGQTLMNSMHLVNVRHAKPALFWDFRAENLETQTLMPIQDHIEMNLTLEEAVAKLNSKPYYPELFLKAFGSTHITTDRISKALAQFVRSLNSYNSPFDRRVPRTVQEQLGFDKFVEGTADPSNPDAASCSECHSSIQQMEFDHQGLPNLAFPLGANGRGFEDTPQLKKVANIRNVALTAPYGHDGRYATLDELLQHHGNDVSEEDRVHLIAFLKTLTDGSFISDKKYSNPFRK